jgi:hypothetical protein
MVSFKTKEESLLYKPVGKIAPLLIPALNKSKVKELLPKADSISVITPVKVSNPDRGSMK